MVESIGAFSMKQFSIDAIKLYTSTAACTGGAFQVRDNEFPFKGASDLGLYQSAMDDNPGTFNGEPAAQYDEFGQEIPRTYCSWA